MFTIMKERYEDDKRGIENSTTFAQGQGQTVTKLSLPARAGTVDVRQLLLTQTN